VTLRREMADKSLSEHFPSVNKVLPWLALATAAVFVLGQSIYSFDFEVHINIDLGITKINYDSTAKEYSIMTAIVRLLTPDDNGHIFPALAVLLFVWSGIWPHVKLLLLYRTFSVAMPHETRARWLAGLGVVGKFSLLDMFLVVLIVSCLQFTNLGNQDSWLTANAREGVYVFSAAVIFSQMLSGYILDLHMQVGLEQLAAREEAVEDDDASPDGESHAADVELQSLVSWDPRYWLCVAGAIVAMGGLVAGTMCSLYALHTAVDFAPLVNTSSEHSYSLWTCCWRCLTSPRNTFGHSLLALLAMCLAGVLPVLHMAAVGLLAVTPLSKAQLLRLCGRVELLAEWAALDVFLLALLPVCLEMGYMCHSLAGGKIKNDPEAFTATVVLGTLACLAQHCVHGLFLSGCHARTHYAGAVEDQGLLEKGGIADTRG